MTGVSREAPTRQRLIEMVEELKLGLTARATGSGMDEERYLRLRKTLLAVPQLKDRLPRFLRTCRTTDEFWGFIKQESPSYQGRRDFLAAQFNPVIDALEQAESTIAQHFTFGERIGAGGFGTVYRVHHDLVGMDFAVKVFSPAFDDGAPAHLDRFFREARVLFSLNHPNIVRVFDVGLREGRPFLRMEFCEGKSLNAVLQEHGRLTPRKAVVLTRKILEGLVHAHEDAKVVHRDLKPSNIMVAPGERVKIVDFGLGIFVEHDLVSRITKTGEAAVGGHYSAPELVTDPTLIDSRSDLYSVAAIWFTALTSRPPAGSSIEAQLRANSHLGEAYVGLLLRGLADLEGRHESARSMLADVVDLEASLTHSGAG